MKHWTTVQLTTNGYAVDNIVYGNGHYVASTGAFAGEDYYSSTNGLSWVRNVQGNAWLTRLKFEDGRFIGVGGGNIISVSTNGMDWTFLQLPSGYEGSDDGMGDVTYGNGEFVDVGQTSGAGYILSSPDGTNWTSRLPVTGTNGYIPSVAFGNSRFVAAGEYHGYVYSSTDGVNWNVVQAGGDGSSVTFCNGLFFIPLLNTNLISTDGIHWTPYATGLKNAELYNIVQANGVYMAAARGYLATSTDGTNWIQYGKIVRAFATDGSRIANFSNVVINEAVATYDGYLELSDPLADVQATNGAVRQVVLSGLVGRQYQIQSSDTLGISAEWQTNATVKLTNTSFVWTDTTTNGSAFYRAALLP